jgi:hypothetical protein
MPQTYRGLQPGRAHPMITIRNEALQAKPSRQQNRFDLSFKKKVSA